MRSGEKKVLETLTAHSSEICQEALGTALTVKNHQKVNSED
jgi:hypothetical protein